MLRSQTRKTATTGRFSSYSSYRNEPAASRSPFLKRGFIIVASLTAMVFLLVLASPLLTGKTTVATYSDCVVSEKSVAVVDGYSQYRIHTENCGTLTVDDSIFDAQFASADVYSSIKTGETHTFEARGHRIPFISAFPNIIRVIK